jgi:L-ascorbate metabolism protein UlaG (beta-lactamase superfamily)
MSKPLFPHRRNGRFYFDADHKPESVIFDGLPSFIRSLFTRRKATPSNPAAWIAADPVVSFSKEPVITWIGHATFLVQLQGINILTDPIFGSASFLYPRLLPPGIAFENLPPIHAVVISHNHRDHMDYPTLRKLKKKNPAMQILVPSGDRMVLESVGFNDVYEFAWEETHVVQHEVNAVTCTFVPAHHWTQRSLFDKNKSLWGGWIIENNDTTIYFAGDTSYSKQCFERIAFRHPYIDVALIPIAPIEPRDWFKHTHTDAHEGGQAFLDLKAYNFIPMHWGTFAFGDDYFELPIHRIKQWWQANSDKLAMQTLHIVKVGQRFMVPPRIAQAPQVTITSEQSSRL